MSSWNYANIGESESGFAFEFYRLESADVEHEKLDFSVFLSRIFDEIFVILICLISNDQVAIKGL